MPEMAEEEEEEEARVETAEAETGTTAEEEEEEELPSTLADADAAFDDAGTWPPEGTSAAGQPSPEHHHE